MAHEIIPDIEKPKKSKTRFSARRALNVAGKFGFSLNLGKKEIFLGVAVSPIEMETYVRIKKLKVKQQAKGRATFRSTDY